MWRENLETEDFEEYKDRQQERFKELFKNKNETNGDHLVKPQSGTVAPRHRMTAHRRL